MTGEHQPAAQTLRPLLESAINCYLAQRPVGGRIRLAHVTLEREGGWVELAIALPGRKGARAYRARIHLQILSTSPERTVCAWRWGKGGGFSRGLTRLVGLGASLLPGDLVATWMGHLLSEGVSLDGERLILEHAPLLRRLVAQPAPPA